MDNLQDNPYQRNGFASGGHRPFACPHLFWPIPDQFPIQPAPQPREAAPTTHRRRLAAHPTQNGTPMRSAARIPDASPTVPRAWRRHQETHNNPQHAGHLLNVPKLKGPVTVPQVSPISLVAKLYHFTVSLSHPSRCIDSTNGKCKHSIHVGTTEIYSARIEQSHYARENPYC